MKRVWIALWLLLVLAVFLRPGFYEYDSYFYLSLACHKEVVLSGELSLARQFFWPALPCLELFMKGLLAAIAGLVFFFCWKIDEELKGSGLFLLVCGLYPFFFSGFVRLEDTGIGLVFVFASLWCLLRSQNTKDRNWFWLAVLLTCVGGLFWKGMLIWLVVVLLSDSFWWTIGVGLIVFFWGSIFSFANGVMENSVWIGFLSCLLLFVGLKVRVKGFWFPLVFAGLLAGVSLKLSIFFALLLAVGCVKWLNETNLFNDSVKAIPFLLKSDLLLLVLLCFSISGIVGLYSGLPNQEIQSIVQQSVSLAHGETIQNEWTFGHMIWYYGGKPNKDSGPPNLPFDSNRGVKLTIEKLNCPIVNQVRLQDVNLKLYRCP